MASGGAEGGSLPRSARLIGIPLAGVLLVAFFVHRGFPYDRLRGPIAEELSRATGLEVAIGEIRPDLQLAGPGVAAHGVRVGWGEGETLAIERVALRPAWSLSWLSGTPALATAIAGPGGAARGTLVTGAERSWSGALRDVDLSLLRIDARWPGAALSGRADAEVELRLAESGPEGTVRLDARDGDLTLPGLSVKVPFDRLHGELAFGGAALVEVRDLALEGTLLSAVVAGTVGRAPRLEIAPLKLEIRIDADPIAQTALRAAGARVARNGSVRLRVTGTAARPVVR